MSTVREKAPSILTAEGARRITARIRDSLALSDDLLARAFEGEAWAALGYVDWQSYCAGELPELRMLKMRAPARRARVKALRDEGANIPQIVAATGASLGTIHADLKALEGGHTRAPSPGRGAAVDPLLETVAPPAEPRWAVVTRTVAAAGTRGMTCLELEERLGWRHGVASGAFYAAERKGRVRRDGRIRDSYGVYSVA